MIGIEIVECVLCGLKARRFEMPKHLKFVHGWKDEHALGFVIPGWVGRIVPTSSRN